MMRYLIILFFCCASFVVCSKDYQLGVGDQIEISVYDEPDLSSRIKVDKTGMISFPFLSDIQVIGLSTKQLAQIIHNGLLGDYLIKPQVSVTIIQYRPFFIHGEVKRPGSYPYQDNLTLDKAIAIAGGLAARASKTNWTITRKVADGVVVETGEVSSRIEPDDIIKIEQSFF